VRALVAVGGLLALGVGVGLLFTTAPIGPGSDDHLPLATEPARAPAPPRVVPPHAAPPPITAERTPAVVPAPAAGPASGAERPLLALVIDDLGWDAAAGVRTLDLPDPITVAVLPGTPSARSLAERAAARGHEVILHQPMEALDARWPGPGGLSRAQDAAELRRMLAANLDAIPHRVGVSNHMGSRLTAEPGAMLAVMAEIAPRGLYFLDSRTTPDTLAERTARASSVPTTRRDVFLDAVIDAASVARALDDVLELAERRGHALAIGHPHGVTLDALEARMAEIRSRVELVPVSRLIEHRAGLPEGRTAVQVAAQ
jgi:polysaccharide deacetylase 2 family uncharacterized protein YibQ